MGIIIPSSKSLMNRALIAQSYYSQFKINGSSDAEDVQALILGLENLKQGQVMNCREGGTTFRFLTLRASRIKGIHKIKASPRLMSRPQEGLWEILKSMSVRYEIHNDGVTLHSIGWKNSGSPVKVATENSSQFLSALALNAWDLDFPLEIEISSAITSESYWQMTHAMLTQLGMNIQNTKTGLLISALQNVNSLNWNVEIDLSSAFSIAALGALTGPVVIDHFPQKSLQPDFQFLDIFSKMEIPFEFIQVVQGTPALQVLKSKKIKSVEVSLASAPDLFPVLSILCAFAEGTSRLKGAPQLIHKESNRIKKTSELLSLLGIQNQIQADGLVIQGNPELGKRLPLLNAFNFDPDQDHRMAMAAGLLIKCGAQIKLTNPQVVNKSFPSFWQILEMPLGASHGVQL